MSGVVLDTNVFVAAGFNPASASAKLVRAVREGQLRMFWDETTRGEIERIVKQIPPLRGHGVGDLFRTVDRVPAATARERFVDVPDPDDRKFAALAHVARAVLVSNDADLLGYRGPVDVAIMTPAAFWDGWQRTKAE